MCIIFVFIFVIMFATGPGSIPWFLVSELFNQSARPTATSLAVCINWTANFLVGLAFLPLAVRILIIYKDYFTFWVLILYLIIIPVSYNKFKNLWPYAYMLLFIVFFYRNISKVCCIYVSLFQYKLYAAFLDYTILIDNIYRNMRKIFGEITEISIK